MTRLLDEAPAPLVFEIRAPARPSAAAWALLRAPYELLAAPEGGFLAEAPKLFAVARRLGHPSPAQALDGHRLGVAFMASAPRGRHELDFEAEEMAILSAVGKTNLDLGVEDSGNPEHLGLRLSELGGMPVVHLSCHGLHNWRTEPDGPATPVLLMEDDLGNGCPTSADALVSLLTPRPRLAFVSACLTATGADVAGHVPVGADRRGGPPAEPGVSVAHSMATGLVTAGIPSVIGWDGSVSDRAATRFAEHLYQQLSRRVELAEAVARARRHLLACSDEHQRADWHLARLWLGPTGGGPLVAGNRKRQMVPPHHVTKTFLDRKHQLPVAATEMFVGRRPETQHTLRALRGGRKAGVLLHGQGRLGKSSLAARIAARHTHRRTTASGARARVRTKALLITPTGSGTGRVGAQAIASGSARLRPLIAEAARRGLRLAFTVRLAKTSYLHPSGSRTDSSGIRRDVIQRTDHTEERSYGSARTGGFDAADFARRVDAAGGDVTTAVHQ
ncbi:CHAT domain-containing protein [Streptomyces sp. NRRL S-37]|uniref:CHAT domain-containing protein n=1 Tax=Streptomyces sp. NRRL S-37 TaxID=1463903 RepID=UPI000A47FBB7|nr:CHAT domain-containing protein [Streptomyces sp. NRRL S-37]